MKKWSAQPTGNEGRRRIIITTLFPFRKCLQAFEEEEKSSFPRFFLSPSLYYAKKKKTRERERGETNRLRKYSLTRVRVIHVKRNKRSSCCVVYTFL